MEENAKVVDNLEKNPTKNKEIQKNSAVFSKKLIDWKYKFFMCLYVVTLVILLVFFSGPIVYGAKYEINRYDNDTGYLSVEYIYYRDYRNVSKYSSVDVSEIYHGAYFIEDGNIYHGENLSGKVISKFEVEINGKTYKTNMSFVFVLLLITNLATFGYVAVQTVRIFKKM